MVSIEPRRDISAASVYGASEYILSPEIDFFLNSVKNGTLYLEVSLLKKDPETSMIYDCIDLTGMDKDLKRVLKEYNDFCKNKTVYLEKLLTLRENHQLFKIKTYMMVDKVHNDEVRNMVMNNYKDVFKKIAKIDFTRNIIYNRFPFKKTIKSLLIISILSVSHVKNISLK